MYTRSYQKGEADEIRIPENYNGTAFMDDDDAVKFKTPEPSQPSPKQPEDDQPVFAQNKNPWEDTSAPTEEKKEEESVDVMGVLKKFPVPNLIQKYIPSLNIFDSFGTEELIILAVALFVLFSGTKDKECAIILFLLLFIKN